MFSRRFWNRSRTHRKEILLQQLEERIVLDAAVSAAQDNPNDHHDIQANPTQGAANSLPSDAAHVAAPDGAATAPADGNAGLVPKLPDSYEQIFHKDLNVVMISNQVANVNAISEAAANNAKVIVYDGEHDNLSTIAAKLQDLAASTGQKIDNLGIVGHGALGVLVIGTDSIDFSSVNNYEPTLHMLAQSLNPDAQIQFFGCNVAGNLLGQAMVDSIATFTTANVFASTDTTGGASHDWTLEFSSDPSVAIHPLFNTNALDSLSTVLANPGMVKDIDTSAASSPSGFTLMNGKIYFTATDTGHGGELWVYDPTSGTASLVKDINPGTASSSPAGFMAIGNTLFFSASDGVNGTELWKSDGTSAGTQMVKDIYPGASNGVPTGLTNLNGTLFFSAYDFDHGIELWKSDGTTAGTQIVADIYSGGFSSFPTGMTVFNGKVYFSATDAAHGNELWATDGTTTSMVADINAGIANSSPSNFTLYGTKLYFSATDATHGNELWATDGTNTSIVADIWSGSNSSIPSGLTVSGNKLFFSATDGTHGAELWATDGTTTSMMADIYTGGVTSQPTSLTDFNGTLYFTALDPTHGSELWKSDGTPGGTVLAKEFVPGTGSGSPTNLASIGASLYLAASDVNHGSEFWKSDGTDAGTVMVRDINLGNTSTPTALTNINGTVFFVDSDGVHGAELWKTDGTAAGTVMVKDINPGSVGSNLTGLTNVNGVLFFSANDGTNGTELWMSDGTEAGTVMVKDIYTGIPSSSYSGSPAYLTDVNGTLYFQAQDSGGSNLWKSDGTSAGTVKVSTSVLYPYNLTNVNGTLFFVGYTSTNGYELYKLDSGGNPLMVKDIYSGSVSSSPSSLTNVNGTLCFIATDSTGTSLWKSDGTSGGTTKFTGGSAAFAQLTNVNGTLFFQGFSSAEFYELWKADPSTGTMSLVKDIWPGANSGYPVNLTNVNGELYFTANDGTNYYELWKSDGTAAGTVMVKDIWPGGNPNASSPNYFTPVNGMIYFAANDGTHGVELWQTDGTAAGTVMVMDINSGSGSSSPTSLIASGNSLFFLANNGDNGTEVWTISGNPNTAPTATNMTQAFTVAEDSGALNLTDIVETDPDVGDTITATLTVGNIASGVLSANDGATYNAATGVWTISGTLANVNTALANVTFTPGANWNGTVNLTTHVQDAAPTGPADGLITVDVTPVNDAPVNTVPLSATVNEDVLTSIAGISISDVDAGTSVVQVSLSVAHGTLFVNDAVIGGLTAAEITGNASGSVLLNGTLAEINATLADATGLQYQSVLNYNGADTLTVFTNDLGATGSPGPMTATDPVAITVNPVNDPPVAVADAYGVNENGVLTVAAAAGVLANDSDVDGPSPLSAILATGPTHGDLTLNADGSFTYTPFANFNGIDSFTYHANDGLADSNVVGVDITVNALNQAPVNFVPGVAQQTLADGSVTFSAANNNLISVSDIDAGAGLLKVTLTATHGTLTLSGVGGLTFDPGQGDGTADATMTFQGTLANINAALDGMRFDHAAGYYGMADVTVTTNDQGNSGIGGPLSATNAAGVSVEQYNVWFQGFGADAGWDTYNYNGGEFYTHDHTVYWQHIDSSNAWNFYNATAWVVTDARGDAPYADGNGPYATWFHDTAVGGTYNGYDVYIGQGVTFVSPDHTAAGATYWQETSAGAWSYYDGSKWLSTAGFNVEPTDAWFHGYGADLGWDTYNYTAGSFYTHDYVVYWQNVTTPNTWNFYNATAWVVTDARGDAPYADGNGPYATWFHDTAVGGTYNGYDVYIGQGVTFVSPDYTAVGATYWQETSAGAWSYYDGSKWLSTAGFNVEPTDAWFHGYGADLGWDTYNYTDGSFFTHDYSVYWQFLNSSSIWNYYDGTAWKPVSGLGSTV